MTLAKKTSDFFLPGHNCEPEHLLVQTRSRASDNVQGIVLWVNNTRTLGSADLSPI